MTLTLKQPRATELAQINALVFESELASVNGTMDEDAFRENYTITASTLLANLSYALYEDSFMAGFFMITCRENVYELKYFYIERNRLGKGYGKYLWGHVNQICVDHKIHELSIVCGKYITPFYEKMGAVKIGEVESLVNRGALVDLLRYWVSG
jgi:GNAT superfamily N-acetyltransferase